MRFRIPATASIAIGLVVAAVLVMAATIRDARHSRDAEAAPAPVRRSPVPGTTRDQLASTVKDMAARLAARPDDAAAAIHLSTALLRLQRVNNDGRAVITAEEQLRRFLDHEPDHYEARRLLAAVLLSQHRFGDAIAEAGRARAVDPNDPWNYGVIGDGYMELGDYPKAFEAIDRMGQIAPGPAAYARTAYGLEINGDLQGALEYMRMAADGTPSNDPESQAWHFTQIGDLLLQLGRVVEARLEYEHAMATFPNHPMAVWGLARIKVIDGDLPRARLMLQSELAKTPTPDLAIAIGDLSAAMKDHQGAESYYRIAEQTERAGWGNGPRQPQALATLFAARNQNLDEAVALAEEAARSRRDIFTMDTLAFVYLKAGRLDDAREASEQAMRTGTRDARLLWHAAEVRLGSNDRDGARMLLEKIPAPDTIGDIRVRRGVTELRAKLK